VIKFNKSSKETTKIERVFIVEEGKCFNVNFILQKDKLPKQLKEINSLGNYTLKASLIETNYRSCNYEKEGLTIFFSDGEAQKKVLINKFVEKTKTRR